MFGGGVFVFCLLIIIVVISNVDRRRRVVVVVVWDIVNVRGYNFIKRKLIVYDIFNFFLVFRSVFFLYL